MREGNSPTFNLEAAIFRGSPEFRELARDPENRLFNAAGLDLEKTYQDPGKRLFRENQAKLVEPYSRKQPLELLLNHCPEKRAAWGHLDPQTPMSRAELFARDDYWRQQGRIPDKPRPADGPELRPAPPLKIEPAGSDGEPESVLDRTRATIRDVRAAFRHGSATSNWGVPPEWRRKLDILREEARTAGVDPMDHPLYRQILTQGGHTGSPHRDDRPPLSSQASLRLERAREQRPITAWLDALKTSDPMAYTAWHAQYGGEKLKGPSVLWLCRRRIALINVWRALRSRPPKKSRRHPA